MDVYIIAAPVCQPKSIRGVRFRSDEGDGTRSTVTCTSSYGFSLQAEASEREGRSREAAAADVDPDVSPTHGRRKVSARCAPDLDPMDILPPSGLSPRLQPRHGVPAASDWSTVKVLLDR